MALLDVIRRAVLALGRRGKGEMDKKGAEEMGEGVEGAEKEPKRSGKESKGQRGSGKEYRRKPGKIGKDF